MDTSFNLKYASIFSCALFNYHKFWIPMVILLFLNALLLFYVNRILRNNSDKDMPKINNYQRASYFIPPVILFVAVIMAFYAIHLGRENFDIMESSSMLINTLEGKYQLRNFDMLQDALSVMIRFAHQFFYPIILNLITKTMGFEYYGWTLRPISVLFSMATIYLTYIFSLKIFKSKFISYMSIIFLSIHSLFLFYSRRVEPYSIFCFLVLLSYYYFWATFISGEEKKIWKYCLAISLCFFIHYLTVVVIFSQFLAIFVLAYRNLCKRPMNYKFLSYIKSIVIFNFIFILWFPFFYSSHLNNTFLFDDAWNNAFYLNQGFLIPVISGIVKLTLGLPALNMWWCLLFFPLMFIIFRGLKKDNPQLFTLLVCLLFADFLFEVCYLLGTWIDIRRFYFNARHFIWNIPLFAIGYAYGASLLRGRAGLFNKMAGYCLLSVILVWNFYLSNKILFGNLAPSYRQALHYIKDNYKNSDFVSYPVGWLKPCVKLNSTGIMDTNVDNLSGTTNLIFLLQKKAEYKRIWLIVPQEDLFGVPHLDPEFMNKSLLFLKQNLALVSIWNGNKITVYLFDTQQ